MTPKESSSFPRLCKRFDILWSAGLVVVGILSRLPFITPIMYHWDAINFTLALRQFNIALHQPQPPGYILYVLLGRLVYALVGDPNRALTGISVAAGVIATLATYWLAKRMFDARVGAAASLLVLSGPLIWFYSEIAKPNIVDAPVVALAALCLWEVLQGDDRYILPSAIVLGLAGGLRQQTLVFLAPLAVFAFHKKRFSQMLLGGAVTSLIFLASFIPMVVLSGGLAKYTAAVSNLESTFFTQTSIFMGGGVRGLVSNVTKWVSFTLYSLLLAGLPLLAWPWVKLRSIPAAFKNVRTWFLAIWILPSVLFYTLIHMGSHGLIFTFLPAVLIIAALALVQLADRIHPNSRPLLAGLLAVIVAANALVFGVVPERPTGGSLHIVNWNTLSENNRFFSSRFDLIQKNFDPAKTLILTEQWRHSQYYLPDYFALSSPCSSEDALGKPGLLYLTHQGSYHELSDSSIQAALPPDLVTIILFDGPAGCFFPGEWNGRLKSLVENGEKLDYIQLERNEAFSFASGTFQIRP
jgi:hypothetical protein